MKIGNLEVYGVIYKIQNKVNNKIYIGQTTIGFYCRYGNSLEKHTHNSYLKRSIKKYGIDNFEIIEVFDVAFSKAELDIKEILWIKHYNCIDKKYGYNNMSGGSYGKHSEETKAKISKNSARIWKGKKFSEEYRKKISLAHMGQVSARKGVRLSDETKKKISKNNPKFWLGKNLTEETKIKISKSHIGIKHTEESKEKIRKARSKKVICITTNKIFNSTKEAKDYYNLKSNSGIIRCCNGERKTSGRLNNGTKLQWKYY